MISVIIPFVNELDFLEEALTSVLDQTYTDLEIILVCNAPEMIRIDSGKKIFQDQRIRWIHEPRRGSAYARNSGLQTAQGEWLQFLDVDDILMPEKLQTQILNASGDVIVSPILYQFVTGEKKPSSWSMSDIWEGLLASHIGSTSSMLWRAETVSKVKGWKIDFPNNHESELIFRILSDGGMVSYNPSILTIVRERHVGSITKEMAHKPIYGIRLREVIWDYLGKNNMQTSGRLRAFQRFVFKHLRALFISDPEQAIQLHQKYMSGTGFLPGLKGIPGYEFLYRTFGFAKTEKLMAVYRKIRRYVPRLLPFHK